jgi:Leucine-rich repeat (LRR) protein
MVGLNNLQALILPATLTQLQELSCHSNYLTELHIPDTLVQLRDIRCSDNRLTSLRIPDTLKQLEQVVCQHMILDESSRVALEALQKKGVNVVL